MVSRGIPFTIIVINRCLGRTRMNTNLSRACKSLSPSHFSYILDLVGEGLTIPSTSEDSLAHLIELSILLLHNHPQGRHVICPMSCNWHFVGTLKSIQNHTTQCLHTFAGRSLFTEGLVSLRIQVLEFIVQHCSDRVCKSLYFVFLHQLTNTSISLQF